MLRISYSLQPSASYFQAAIFEERARIRTNWQLMVPYLLRRKSSQLTLGKEICLIRILQILLSKGFGVLQIQDVAFSYFFWIGCDIRPYRYGQPVLMKS